MTLARTPAAPPRAPRDLRPAAGIILGLLLSLLFWALIWTALR